MQSVELECVRWYSNINYIFITFMHLADAFIQSDLQAIKKNTQCSTTEPQEHIRDICSGFYILWIKQYINLCNRENQEGKKLVYREYAF